ncbi:hypothetical protein [Rhizobium sp. 32-5/1]|uniref:hypothetical protein n=1 Tax=Rhizobium sp. 32-5/1 TaxID=3019602 RepID=UPI0032B79F26
MTVALLTLPLSFGLLGTVLPALGYLPALGGHEFGLAHFKALLAVPGLEASVLLSLASGFAATALSVVVTAVFLAAFAGTRMLSRLQHALSPLLAIPHAAAAFGLAFLIAPSGYLIRLAAPFAGIDRPPDLLILHDPLGLSMTAGLVLKEMPFLFLVSLAALPQVDLLLRGSFLPRSAMAASPASSFWCGLASTARSVLPSMPSLPIPVPWSMSP